MQSKIVTVLSFVAAVSAHGKVTSPTPRVAGAAFKEACGTTMWNTEQSDPYGNIQGLAQQAGSSLDASKCELALCKGYKFADNTNIQSYSPGETIDFKVEIRAPHTGVANVSVVDTTSNSVIGSPLISFTNYASTKTGVAANNTAFSVTLPDSLPSNCGTAGNCVLQWWWDSAEAGQTYMSCVDFSTGSGSGSSGSTTPAASAAPTTLATVATPSATPSTPASGNSGASDESAATPSATSSAPASSCNKRRSSKRALRKRF
ncbi:chitin binding protein [Colletotrichum kahawae]|uniref:Chitin binding protein n=1 Tax=Colletotrichum kahawae TaxID=34407 RepID=A0AAE0D9H9_COLKA|nr:chitin binding protein [Colletotrichum kahawae]